MILERVIASAAAAALVFGAIVYAISIRGSQRRLRPPAPLDPGSATDQYLADQHARWQDSLSAEYLIPVGMLVIAGLLITVAVTGRF